MNGITKQITGLSIQTLGQLVVLTNGQKGLLKCIRHCVDKNKVLDWDLIVQVYTENVRSYYYDGWIYVNGEKTEMKELVIADEFRKQSAAWTYTLRGLVRQWLLSNIGILVLKNQLVIIPTIEIE